MTFQGFEVTPVGNATLQIEEGKLKVSNIGISGCDGILVEKGNAQNYKINFDEIPNLSIPNSFIKYATLFKNYLGLPVTVNERFEWCDIRTKKLLVGYNLNLLPQKFHLVGYLGEDVVFDIEVDKDNPPPPDTAIAPVPPLLVWIATIASLIMFADWFYEKFIKTEDYVSPHFVFGTDGSCRFAGWVAWADPLPFDVKVDNQLFTIDKFGIKVGEEYNPPLPAGSEEYFFTSYATMLTAAGVGSFTIASIEEVTS